MAPVGTKARMSMLSDRSSAARLKSSDQCTEEPPIKSAPPRPFDLAADDDELLAKRSGSRRPRLPGEQRRPGRCRTGSEGGRSRLRALTTSACSWQGADLAPRWPRHRRKDRIRFRSRTEYCAPHAGVPSRSRGLRVRAMCRLLTFVYAFASCPHKLRHARTLVSYASRRTDT